MSKPKQDHYIIYTDGACKGNPGPGGYGVYAQLGETVTELSKGYKHTTNNRMEVMAVIAALEEFGPGIKVDIYTDSDYTIKAATKWIKGWARNDWVTYNTGQPVKNRDLHMVFNELLKLNKVKFHWVRGHSGNFGNEIADSLASEACKTPETIDVGYMKSIGAI